MRFKHEKIRFENHVWRGVHPRAQFLSSWCVLLARLHSTRRTERLIRTSVHVIARYLLLCRHNHTHTQTHTHINTHIYAKLLSIARRQKSPVMRHPSPVRSLSPRLSTWVINTGLGGADRNAAHKLLGPTRDTGTAVLRKYRLSYIVVQYSR